MSEGRGLGDRLAERISGAPPAPPIADPCAWIEEQFATTLYSHQRQIVDAVHDHSRVACRAAHSTGKSRTAGLLGAFWVATHPLGSAFVFTTAPTTAQIRGIVWKEVGHAHRVGNLPGRITGGQNPEWMIGDELVGTGRKPADLVDPEEAATSMQGIHAEHLLVILDEAAGLAPWVWDAVDSLASNAGAKLLALGNPTVRESTFFEVCQPGSGWHSMKISAFDSPNLSGEVVPDSVARNLVSAEWVQSRRRKWGEKSSMYRSRVLGEFPEADADGLIEPIWVEQAQALELPGDGPAAHGVDVARSGSDESVIAENRGGRLRVIHTAQGADTMATTGALLRALAEAGEDATAAVDVIGVGSGVFDRAREQNAPVGEFNSSSKPRDPKRFKNRRAEAYWKVREELKAGRIDLDPADEDLAAQLLAIRWSLDSSGRIVIESKEAMKARGVSSPDRADAAMMALADVGGGAWAVFAEAVDDEADAVDRSLALQGSGGELGDLTTDLLDKKPGEW
jgi:hypothetical protein